MIPFWYLNFTIDNYECRSYSEEFKTLFPNGSDNEKQIEIAYSKWLISLLKKENAKIKLQYML